MLLERIRNDAVLSKYLSDDCEENDVCITFDDKEYFNRDLVKTELLFVNYVRNYRRNAASAIEVLLEKRFMLRGKRLMLKICLPTPTIKPC